MHEEAQNLYMLAWFSLLATWGEGEHHRWKLAMLGHWMDDIQGASDIQGKDWQEFIKTVPGLLEYWQNPVSWRAHRGVKPGISSD